MQERQRTRSSRERLQLIFHLSFLHGRNPSAAERLITVREQQAIGAAERAKDARKFSHGTVIIPHTADGGETAGLGDKKAGEEAGQQTARCHRSQRSARPHLLTFLQPLWPRPVFTAPNLSFPHPQRSPATPLVPSTPFSILSL